MAAKTFQNASVPGSVAIYAVATANWEDGKALNVTDVMTPKVEPPPYINIS
jgi:hypothetical protein